MASALLTSHDGIVAIAGVDEREVAARLDRLARRRTGARALRARFMALSPAWRSAVLVGALASRMEVRPVDGAAPAPEARGDEGRPMSMALHVRAASGDWARLATLSRPRDAELAKQIGLVRVYADLRAERLAEIDAQRSDLVGFFGQIDRFAPQRSPHLIEILSATLEAATLAAQGIKFAFDVPRPVELSSHVMPIIPTPTHSSYPSGHAAQAMALAAVLTHLADDRDSPRARKRLALAARIAVNRTVAGVHYPVDSACGAALGGAIGDWIAGCGGEGGGAVPTRAFDGGAFGEGDFHAGTLGDGRGSCDGGRVEVAGVGPLAPIWAAAREELA